jgi:hypothetical protein
VSSPLDGRIRALAREEATALLGGAPVGADLGSDRVAALESAVTSLHGTLLRLEARIDALEKATGQTDQEARPTARRTRKASGE